MTSIEYSMEPPSGLLRHHHYPHQQARSVVSQMPSVSSSSGASGASSSVGGCRVRFVRLVRKRNESYGFSLRGGLEHGTGFFISHVEPASEAFMQGLRAGDQLLSVNNISVDKAIHREVTAMVQSKSSVILKVKSTGIIPVKEHRGDPLTWLMVDEDEDDNLSNGAADPYSHSGQENDYRGFRSSSSHEPSHVHGGSAAANNCRAQVVISCGGKVGLGCSICKGPPEKPGIFVQSVKPGGVAKSAGLRPGDQILACNDISFTHLEFAEAVYVLKSSPHLVLDILRGAGLDFVAGESSGYNSSASSIAGDQTPPSSSSDPRDSDHSVTSRLSAVSQHLSLDRSRGWKEIEAEWADAEAAEKRHQLQSAQRILRTRAQRDANHRLNASNSRSLCNLSVGFRDDDNEESTAFRDTGHPYSPVVPSASRLPAHTHYKPALRSTRSSSDVSSDTSHKIALVTSHDPHVSNIVVTGGPKNERDAVSRLEQLSSPSASRTSTLSSGTSQVTVRSSSGSMGLGAGNSSSGSSLQVTESLVEQQLRELREEQRKLQEEANLLAEERRKFEEERRRGLVHTQSAPLTPLVISCSGQSLLPHHQAPPSPTSSIASGRHTTRVLIKSPPPPPPPRKNTTTLSSCRSHSHQVSPPASPAHSSSSSSGVGSLCGSGAPPRRCKSIGSLSASSSESTVWEDLPLTGNLSSSINNSHCTIQSTVPPPPPPKPSAPQMSQHSNNETQILRGVPPPPPPPPPQPSHNHQPSLASALSRELERRSAQESLSGDVDDETKAKAIQDKIDAFKKDKQKSVTIDPKRAQHDKLMEEFKLAHRRMFDAKPVSEEEVKEEKPVVRFQGHQKLSRAPASTTPVNSKIIDRLNQNLSTNKVEVKSKVPSAISKNISSSSNVQNLDNLNSGHEINDMTSISKRKEMFNNMSVSGHKPSASLASRESQQDEICRSTTPKPSVIIKTKQPVHGKSVVMEEFKMSEKAMSSSSLCPPDTYFDVHKENSSKPLVSIGTYPSPNDRPAPVKMDFLPSTCVNVDVNGTSKYDGSSRDQLQNELTSTLTRSNIRQRLHAQELPPSPIPSNSSSPASKEPFTSNAASATFTTTTIQNNNTNPSASLSSKYRGIVTDSPVNGPEGSP
ncbi:serine/arginine repetitive matrix protein 2-like isoform X2 [Macrobrachium nipponense]|uniref:serine/arginine repetitive matrix protein 2-like isoform X2 n=1 Tax=Macrobrachium nipponense TaxID=159736 RepID=UPI0030C8807D